MSVEQTFSNITRRQDADESVPSSSLVLNWYEAALIGLSVRNKVRYFFVHLGRILLPILRWRSTFTATLSVHRT